MNVCLFTYLFIYCTTSCVYLQCVCHEVLSSIFAQSSQESRWGFVSGLQALVSEHAYKQCLVRAEESHTLAVDDS